MVDALERGAPQANEGGDSRLDLLDAARTSSTRPRRRVRRRASWAVPCRRPPSGARPAMAVRVARFGSRSVPAPRCGGPARSWRCGRRSRSGEVTAVQPPIGILEQDGFDGKFSFQLGLAVGRCRGRGCPGCGWRSRGRSDSANRRRSGPARVGGRGAADPDRCPPARRADEPGR